MSPCHCVKFPCGSRRTSREKQATDRMAAGLRRKPKPPAFTVSALWVHRGKLSETTDRPICCVLTGGNRSGTRAVAGFQPLRVSPEPEPPAFTGSALLQGANTPGFVSTYIAQVLDSQRKATRHKGMSGDVVVLNTHGRRRKNAALPSGSPSGNAHGIHPAHAKGSIPSPLSHLASQMPANPHGCWVFAGFLIRLCPLAALPCPPAAPVWPPPRYPGCLSLFYISPPHARVPIARVLCIRNASAFRTQCQPITNNQ